MLSILCWEYKTILPEPTYTQINVFHSYTDWEKTKKIMAVIYILIQCVPYEAYSNIVSLRAHSHDKGPFDFIVASYGYINIFYRYLIVLLWNYFI